MTYCNNCKHKVWPERAACSKSDVVYLCPHCRAAVVVSPPKGEWAVASGRIRRWRQ